jgi:hypothetical protein
LSTSGFSAISFNLSVVSALKLVPYTKTKELSMKETLEQFIARGGVIVKLDAVEPSSDGKVSVNSTNNSINILGLNEGALYFADKAPSRKTSAKVKLSKPKKTRAPKLNLSLLPPHIAALVTGAEETADEEAKKSEVLRERG